jgi:hypothetical protein
MLYRPPYGGVNTIRNTVHIHVKVTEQPSLNLSSVVSAISLPCKVNLHITRSYSSVYNSIRLNTKFLCHLPFCFYKIIPIFLLSNLSLVRHCTLARIQKYQEKQTSNFSLCNKRYAALLHHAILYATPKFKRKQKHYWYIPSIEKTGKQN